MGKQSWDTIDYLRRCLEVREEERVVETIWNNDEINSF